MDNSLALMDQISKRMVQINDSQININNHLVKHNARLLEIEESLEKRVYLSSGEMLEIRRHIKAAVSSIAKREGWAYKLVSKMLFNAIYTDINEQYDVPSYHDLPSKYRENIIQKIDRWSPNQAIRDRIVKKLSE